MKKLLRISLATLPLLFASTASALDTSAPVLCASVDVHECVDGAGWTIMVEQDTARMVATVATRQAAIVIFRRLHGVVRSRGSL